MALWEYTGPAEVDPAGFEWQSAHEPSRAMWVVIVIVWAPSSGMTVGWTG